MKRLIFIQCFLCTVLVILCVFTTHRKGSRSVEAGTFGADVFYNDTFEDLTQSIFGAVFNE